MGQFASFADFLQMGKHGLYVWLSYAIFLSVLIYNIASVVINKKVFFKDAKRRLRREKQASS